MIQILSIFVFQDSGPFQVYPNSYENQAYSNKFHGESVGGADVEVVDDYGTEEQIEEYLAGYERVLAKYVKRTANITEMNFPVQDFSFRTLKTVLSAVFHEMSGRSGRISVQPGFLLKNDYTNGLMLFYAGYNRELFNSSHLIENKQNLDNLLSRLKDYDWAYNLQQVRKESMWSFLRGVQIHFIINFSRA